MLQRVVSGPGWLPPGTREWRKFIAPAEFDHRLRRYGFEDNQRIQARDFRGISYHRSSGRVCSGILEQHE